MMIWTIAGWIGRIAWPALRGLAPWGNANFTMALTIGLLAFMLIAGPAGAMWLHMRGEVKLSKQTCDLKWKTKLSEIEREHNNIVDEAIEAGRDLPPVPADRIERMQLCQQSPTCRDHSG